MILQNKCTFQEQIVIFRDYKIYALNPQFLLLCKSSVSTHITVQPSLHGFLIRSELIFWQKENK